MPADTRITIQIAGGATPALAMSAPFAGPDGTTVTSFGPVDAALPYGWDFGNAYFVARIALKTADPGITPTVDAIALEYDLREVAQARTPVIETDGANPDSDWVLRIWTEHPVLVGATATMTYVQSSGLIVTSDMSVDLGGVAQIVAASGSATQTSGPAISVGPGFAHSITVDTNDMTGAVLDAVWETQLAGTGILVQHRTTSRQPYSPVSPRAGALGPKSQGRRFRHALGPSGRRARVTGFATRWGPRAEEPGSLVSPRAGALGPKSQGHCHTGV